MSAKKVHVNEGINYEKVGTENFLTGMYFIKIESNLGAVNNKVYIQK